MKWLIGLRDGKVTFEGGTPCGCAVVAAEFDPADFERARVFASEWMLSDPRNVITFRSSFDHPGDEGLDEDFDASEWMLQVCSRAV